MGMYEKALSKTTKYFPIPGLLQHATIIPDDHFRRCAVTTASINEFSFHCACTPQKQKNIFIP
jgi:hypothetical protein